MSVGFNEIAVTVALVGMMLFGVSELRTSGSNGAADVEDSPRPGTRTMAAG